MSLHLPRVELCVCPKRDRRPATEEQAIKTMSSRKLSIYVLLFMIVVRIGNFFSWHPVARFLHNCPSTTPLPNDETTSQPYNNIHWSNETAREEIIQIALEKYKRKSTDKLDLLHGIGIAGVLRALDPMGGRTSGCLEGYFRHWTNNIPSTANIPRDPLFESFFEWLDDGQGGRVVDANNTDSGTKCNWRMFDLMRYRKFAPTERDKTEIHLEVDKNGRISNITYAYNGTIVDRGKYIFVWSLDRKLFLLDASQKNDTDYRIVGHATFFGGKPVRFAGELRIKHWNHTLKWTSNESGHYKPTLVHMRNFCEYLRDEKGVNVTAIEWRSINGTLDPNWVSDLGKNQSGL